MVTACRYISALRVGMIPAGAPRLPMYANVAYAAAEWGGRVNYLN